MLQLFKVSLFHLLSPAPILNLCIFDITTGLENVPAISTLEESIHLLQTAARGFRIHEYHEWQAEDVEPEEQQQSTVAYSLKEEGRDHGNNTISNRPAHNGPSTTFCADVKREYLGWVKPGCRQPRSSKRSSIEESKGGDSGTIGSLIGSFDLCKFV